MPSQPFEPPGYLRYVSRCQRYAKPTAHKFRKILIRQHDRQAIELVRADIDHLMLMAGPVLQAAYLEEPFTRLLLPIIAYVWIIVGMFWVGMPFLMRDWIDWLISKEHPKRWTYACGIGVGYGLLMILCAASWSV